MNNLISENQWADFDEHGYVKLGNVVEADTIEHRGQRINEIMLGQAELNYDQIPMQEDADPDAYETPQPHTQGHKGGHLNYRKIQKLEFDPFFLRYMQLSIFQEACARIYGTGPPITALRAMFINKPAGRGTFLRWHQDLFNFLSATPFLTAWTALDTATVKNGCIQIIPGSHKLGYLNPNLRSAFLTDEQVDQHCSKEKVVHLTVNSGEVIFLHNWLLHSSDRNNTDTPRRAFSVCYMDAATKRIDGPDTKYTQIFGPDALTTEQLEASA